MKLDDTLRLRAYHDCILCREAIAAGIFENIEQDFVRRVLRPGDVFVDVGANVGLFTVIAAKAVGSSGRVYSFEPCRKTFNRLLRNVKDNGFRNVECFRYALSDEPATRMFNVSLDGYDAWNSFAAPVAEGRFSGELVEAVRLDDFAASGNFRPGIMLIKIDVEGWERQMLLGARELLSGPDAPTLIVEFTEENAEAAGNHCSDVFSLLETYGYRLYDYSPNPRVLTTACNRDYFSYTNLYAVKPQALDTLTARLTF